MSLSQGTRSGRPARRALLFGCLAFAAIGLVACGGDPSDVNAGGRNTTSTTGGSAASDTGGSTPTAAGTTTTGAQTVASNGSQNGANVGGTTTVLSSTTVSGSATASSSTTAAGTPATGAASGAATTTATSLVPVELIIQDFKFPRGPQLIVGAVVTWKNADPYTHQIVANDGSFGSQPLQKGDTYTHTFTKPGTYTYYCAIHNVMTGTLVVS